MLFLSEWIDVQYSDFSGSVFEHLESFIAEMPSSYRKPLISKIQNSMKPKPKATFCLFEPTKVCLSRFYRLTKAGEASAWSI